MVKLDVCEFVPMQDDESPGMPSFKVKGTQQEDGKNIQFEGTISVELDGRDIDWDGTPDQDEMADWETNILCDVVEMISQTPEWVKATKAHGF